MQVTFRPVKSSMNSPSFLDRAAIVNSPPSFQNSETFKNSNYVPVDQPKLGESTPMKVTMKKVASSRKLSGMGESLSFGSRTKIRDNDSISSSSDSGIDVMQYDWTVPCCKNDP
jgi:hypothetical protein